MTVQAYIIMTTAQKTAAELLDNTEQMLGPRQIDNSLANALGEGVLVAKWVSPARLLNDPEYTRWVPEMEGYPIRVFDSETLFLPPPPEE